MYMKSMVKIRIVLVGVTLTKFQVKRLAKWKSDLFCVVSDNGHYSFDNNKKPDLPRFAYSDDYFKLHLPSDAQVSQQAKDKQKADLIVYIVDAPIEGNWYSRIFDTNRIVITLYQAKQILKDEHIPFENFILKRLYMYSLLYLKKGNAGINMRDEEEMLHYTRKGCIFDSCFIKKDFIDSCLQPIICSQCKNALIESHIKKELVDVVDKELKRMTRGCYLGTIHWLQNHPISNLLFAALVSAFVSYLFNILSAFVI